MTELMTEWRNFVKVQKVNVKVYKQYASRLSEELQEVLDTVLDENSLRPAAYIPGNDFTGPLIILRDTDNSLEQLINGGHEIGHALYNALKKDLLRQPEVRARLMKSFLASASGKALIQKYDDDEEAFYTKARSCKSKEGCT